VSLFTIVVFALPAHADIFQWEYINPDDPSQGRQQSTTLCPDGAGVDPVTGADLSSRDLRMAYLIGADLARANAYRTNLYDADLSLANLIDSSFFGADLIDAHFTNAAIRRANFGIQVHCNPVFCLQFGSGLALSQLYSTASYQAHDLNGVGLDFNDLSGGNFVGQDLTNANFTHATLTAADFTDTQVRGADFSGTGISLAQIYSTASYQTHNLSGVGLSGNYLIGGNFAGQNLTNVDFHGTNLTAADTRGAIGLYLANARTRNLIEPDGYIRGLQLWDLYYGEETLEVRDPADIVPITIDHFFGVTTGGTLRMVFEEDAWDSTISFVPGIPITLGGTLELTFADNVSLASQVGRTFDVFDWTGVSPTGAFAINSPHAWDLSNLYTTGEVTLTAIPEPTAIVLVMFGLAVCGRRTQPRTCGSQRKWRRVAGCRVLGRTGKVESARHGAPRINF
jgi:uncharacterized protein YjbI with pentapeptide repeats